MILSSRGHLAISGDILVVTNWVRDTTAILWGEAGGAANHPIIHRTTPPNKEPSRSKCESVEKHALNLYTY